MGAAMPIYHGGRLIPDSETPKVLGILIPIDYDFGHDCRARPIGASLDSRLNRTPLSFKNRLDSTV